MPAPLLLTIHSYMDRDGLGDGIDRLKTIEEIKRLIDNRPLPPHTTPMLRSLHERYAATIIRWETARRKAFPLDEYIDLPADVRYYKYDKVVAARAEDNFYNNMITVFNNGIGWAHRACYNFIKHDGNIIAPRRPSDVIYDHFEVCQQQKPLRNIQVLQER